LFLFLLLLLFSLHRQLSQSYCCCCNFFPSALRKVMFGFSFVLYSLRDNSFVFRWLIRRLMTLGLKPASKGQSKVYNTHLFCFQAYVIIFWLHLICNVL
jgi:hypothetical protein